MPSIDDNRRGIDETATLAAAGAAGSRAGVRARRRRTARRTTDLVGARERVADALAELAPDAQAAGVTLAIEPLHPMYASDRAVVSTLKQALDLAEPFDPSVVGVTVDTFHVWWDPRGAAADRPRRRGGPHRDLPGVRLEDPAARRRAARPRHYPGDGVIDFATLTAAVEATGYAGDIEVEIFNQEIWDTPFAEVDRAHRGGVRGGGRAAPRGIRHRLTRRAPPQSTRVIAGIVKVPSNIAARGW